MKRKSFADVSEVKKKTLDVLNNISTEEFQKGFSSGKNVGTSVLSQKDNSQPRSTPCGRLLEYCVVSQYLVAHRANTSSSRATFKFRLFLGPPHPLVRSL
jgi:hypothetical protein